MTSEGGPRDAVVIERILNAPVDLVWRMWTEPERFSAWYGPEGATVPVARMDVRVGGRRLIAMAMPTPSGVNQMWFTGEYLEVLENRRLVYTESVADENGKVLLPSEMGMPMGHPTTTEVTVELVDLGGRTRLIMTHVGVPADSPGAIGWRMAFDKLAIHLEARDYA